ncbi:hypothetical protein ES319_D07G244700v1 [Gossypium barbadense]|uniref:Uncharacterized protein n=2 Tax=Gossypium TaxID=3633 RepID=A0A5J5QWI6_GOSBA|nr:hypothetical protein ES319_D07G244700v1 [Gossypium barbadense]KAB2022897.1 hypothetical protein ES319_D07G244700v1 [Gossypium barbadense]TYG62820.1 hypothetical protein ES288_D07G262700v1 [Gossypium darwinii]TYG62821.1 hypothetical protein ES288_D07G262700v1 [Gossypium darwinii]
MSQCQPCDSEGEPLPSTELNEAWKLANAPKNDKFQYTHFAHKINSFDTTPKKLLASDSLLRPDRHALEQGDLSKAGFEKSSDDDDDDDGDDDGESNNSSGFEMELTRDVITSSLMNSL